MHERGTLWTVISGGIWVITYHAVWSIHPQKAHKKRGILLFPTPIFEMFSPKFPRYRIRKIDS